MLGAPRWVPAGRPHRRSVGGRMIRGAILESALRDGLRTKQRCRVAPRTGGSRWSAAVRSAGRTDGIVPRMTTRTDPAAPLVVPPAATVPGRTRPATPLRREGPAKLTGTALYTDDIVVPGAWYGTTIRSTDAH